MRAALGERPLVSTAPGMVLAHGSPAQVDQYVRSEFRARELLDQMQSQHPTARVLVMALM